MELVDAGRAQCRGIEVGQVVSQDVLHFRQHALQRAIDVNDAALGVGDHHIGADVVQGGAHAQCFAGDQVVAFQARAQVIAHGARVEQQPAEFVMPVDFDRVVQAAGRHVAEHAFHRQQRAGDHLARGDEHHRDAQCQHHQREQQHAAHQRVQRAVDGTARLRADHRPLPWRIALCGDFERLAGALGIAQLQAGAGLLAVQHCLQQGLLFGRHQCRQCGRGARRSRDDLALVIARRHVDDHEIAVLAQFGGADLGLERGQALGVVTPDEQRTNDLAGGIAQRLVMGHVLLAEQLRLAGEALALRQGGVGLALAIEQGADDAFVLLVAQRGGDAHEVVAGTGEDRGNAAGRLGKAVHGVDIEIQCLLAGM